MTRLTHFSHLLLLVVVAQFFTTTRWLSCCNAFSSTSTAFSSSTRRGVSQRRRSLPARTVSSQLAASNANELMPLRPGSTVALVTPFLENGDIDFTSLKKLLQYHLDAGTDNLCVLGTTAEAAVMSMDERASILKVAVEMCKGQVPLLVGVGTIAPTKVRDYSQQALDAGCDAALVVTPYYVKPPQRLLVKHFVDLADQTDLPICLYNVPSRTGVDLSDESAALCAQHESIVALKDATGNVDRVSRFLSLLEDDNDDFMLLSGDDATAVDFCLAGGQGSISVTANVAAGAVRQALQAALAGNADEAHALDASLTGLHRDLFCEANPMPTKWALERLGVIQTSYCRPPLASMDAAAYEDTVTAALVQAGLL